MSDSATIIDLQATINELARRLIAVRRLVLDLRKESNAKAITMIDETLAELEEEDES